MTDDDLTALERLATDATHARANRMRGIYGADILTSDIAFSGVAPKVVLELVAEVRRLRAALEPASGYVTELPLTPDTVIVATPECGGTFELAPKGELVTEHLCGRCRAALDGAPDGEEPT
jgi:hypothetical protein